MIINVQVLRAFAAALVVFHHLQPMVNDATGTRVDTQFGAAGVDIFFVISGFIMFQTTKGFERSSGEFWRDRIIRIIPLYWLVTFVIVGIYLAGRHPTELTEIDGGDVATSLFLIPDVRADGIEQPVLSLGWTLIYEMFFYFVFGLTFFMRSHWRSLIAITVLFGALILAGVLLGPFPHVLNYFTNLIMLEFSVGCLLSLAYDRWTIVPNQRFRLLGYGMLVIGVALLFASEPYAKGEPIGLLDRPLIYGVPAFLIVSGALVLEKSGRRWNSRLMLMLGAASYALYLTHPLVMQPITKTFNYIAQTDFITGIFGSSPMLGGYPYGGLAAIVAFTAALAVAVGIHLWIEKPLQRFFKAGGRRKLA